MHDRNALKQKLAEMKKLLETLPVSIFEAELKLAQLKSADKACTKCKEVKGKREFYPNDTNFDGFEHIC